HHLYQLDLPEHNRDKGVLTIEALDFDADLIAGKLDKAVGQKKSNLISLGLVAGGMGSAFLYTAYVAFCASNPVGAAVTGLLALEMAAGGVGIGHELLHLKDAKAREGREAKAMIESWR